MIEFISKNQKQNLILFVHGFIGGRETWVDETNPHRILNYLMNDKYLHEQCDFALFNYFTQLSDKFATVKWLISFFSGGKKLKKNLSIDDLSDLLCSEIQVNLKQYERIILVAHSMGGLVSKSCILKMLDNGNESKIVLYISLAVPHNGSDLATLGRIILNNPQVEDLGPLQIFLNDVNQKWIKQKALPATIYHQGKNDNIVPKTSSIGYDVRDIKPVYSDDDHFSILKPEKEDDIVVTSIADSIKAILTNPPGKAGSEKSIEKDQGSSDSFSNISGSVIINRSEVKGSFNK